MLKSLKKIFQKKLESYVTKKVFHSNLECSFVLLLLELDKRRLKFSIIRVRRLQLKRTRRRYEAEEKVAILKRHLLGKESVSDICDDIGLSPNQFYRWQKEFFDNGAATFQNNGRRENAKLRKMEEKVEFLEGKLRHKDNVIAEITEDYVHLKKSLGEA